MSSNFDHFTAPNRLEKIIQRRDKVRERGYERQIDKERVIVR